MKKESGNPLGSPRAIARGELTLAPERGKPNVGAAENARVCGTDLLPHHPLRESLPRWRKQKGADCHDSDVGHCLAMTGLGPVRSARAADSRPYGENGGFGVGATLVVARGLAWLLVGGRMLVPTAAGGSLRRGRRPRRPAVLRWS